MESILDHRQHELFDEVWIAFDPRCRHFVPPPLITASTAVIRQPQEPKLKIHNRPQSVVFLWYNTIILGWTRTSNLRLRRSTPYHFTVSTADTIIVSVSVKKAYVSRLKRFCHFISFSIKVNQNKVVLRPYFVPKVVKGRNEIWQYLNRKRASIFQHLAL